MKLNHLSPSTVVLEELGARLQSIRKQQRYTQDELAAKAGLGVATLRRIEDGKDAQLGSWIKILKALDMLASIDQLLPETFNSPLYEVLSKRRSVYSKNSSKKSGVTVWGDQINEPE